MRSPRILLAAGSRNLAVVDSRGIISRDRDDLTEVKLRIAEQTNAAGLRGELAHAMKGADVFIGVSGGEIPESVVATMAPGAVIFALANPSPEVHPDMAHRYARVVATGRSDYPNQINNVLAFPGVFRGLLDARASEIEIDMLLRAAQAIAHVVKDDELNPNFIIPTVFHPDVPKAVAAAISGRPAE